LSFIEKKSQERKKKKKKGEFERGCSNGREGILALEGNYKVGLSKRENGKKSMRLKGRVLNELGSRPRKDKKNEIKGFRPIASMSWETGYPFP